MWAPYNVWHVHWLICYEYKRIKSPIKRAATMWTYTTIRSNINISTIATTAEVQRRTATQNILDTVAGLLACWYSHRSHAFCHCLFKKFVALCPPFTDSPIENWILTTCGNFHGIIVVVGAANDGDFFSALTEMKPIFLHSVAKNITQTANSLEHWGFKRIRE